MSSSLSDREILDGILQGGGGQWAYENQLYERYSYLIRDGAWKHKLTTDDCSMVYSDTILTIIDHIRFQRFEGRSELKTYIYQIFNNKCVDALRKMTTNKQQVNRGVSVEDYSNVLSDKSRSIVDALIAQHEVDLLRKKMRELGDKCYHMLQAWSQGFLDAEIASDMGYQSAAVVKTSRLRCLEKLRGLYGQL